MVRGENKKDYTGKDEGRSESSNGREGEIVLNSEKCTQKKYTDKWIQKTEKRL